MPAGNIRKKAFRESHSSGSGFGEVDEAGGGESEDSFVEMIATWLKDDARDSPDYLVGQCGECIIFVWIVNNSFRQLCVIRREPICVYFSLIEKFLLGICFGKKGRSQGVLCGQVCHFLLLLLRLCSAFPSYSRSSLPSLWCQLGHHLLLNVRLFVDWVAVKCYLQKSLWMQRENEWKEIVSSIEGDLL